MSQEISQDFHINLKCYIKQNGTEQLEIIYEMRYILRASTMDRTYSKSNANKNHYTSSPILLVFLFSRNKVHTLPISMYKVMTKM